MNKTFLLLIISHFICAQAIDNLIVDRYFSPYAGGEDIVTGHHITEKVSNIATQYCYDKISSDLGKIGLRSAEMCFLWVPLNYSAMVVQHEVFGHGYRVRSTSGAKVIKYEIGAPPPYGDGGGATIYQYNPFKTSIFQKTCIASGGVEATSILANRLRLHWLEQGQLPASEAFLYVFSQQDITDYILRSQGITGQGNDISDYTQILSRAYGKKIVPQDLKGVCINFLDPFTYYALYSIGNYVFTGKETSIPMIPIKSYKYLPSFRMGLTPFGPEYYLEGFLVKENSPIYFYLRGGSFAENRYFGAGVEYSELFKLNALTIGLCADAWLQPFVNFNSSKYSIYHLRQRDWEPLDLKNYDPGLALSVICRGDKNWFVQLGGKSSGYLPGELLSSAVILRLGATW